MNLLADDKPLRPDQAPAVVVNTQVSCALGRPDFEILTPNALIFVEVKVESGLTGDQLSRYNQRLVETGRSSGRLILLTRYPVETDADTGQPDVKRRWYQLAEWLCKLTSDKAIKYSESRFLVRQFLNFLQARNVTMEHVGWELKAGVQSLMSLMQMLDEAIASQKEGRTVSVAKDYSGFYVRESQGWVGINYDDPAKLCLHTYQIRIDTSIAESLGGCIKGQPTSSEYPNGLRWELALQLDSEEVHFFARSPASQMEEIEKFVKQGFEGLSKLLPRMKPSNGAAATARSDC